MKLSHLLFSPARAFGAVMLCAFMLPVIATADEQFAYSAGGGAIAGFVTYTACGDSEPVAWSITEFVSASEWTEADTTFTSWLTVWAGCVPTFISYVGIDDVVPLSSGAVVNHDGFGPGMVFTPSNGLLAVDPFVPFPHAHTPVPTGGPLGIAILTTLLGIAGIRKLRA